MADAMVTPVKGKRPPGQRVNWLAVTFGAQVILFGTFILAFFTIEQSRTSEMHDMQAELHRLRRENFKSSKRLLQANRKVLNKEMDLEHELKGEGDGRYTNDIPYQQEDDEGDHHGAGEEEEEGEGDASAGAGVEHKAGGGKDPLLQGEGNAVPSAPGCASLVKEWWTYEVCPGKTVRQFHAKDTRGEQEGHMLGHFSEEASSATEQKYVAGEACPSAEGGPRGDGLTRRANVALRCVDGASELRIISVRPPTEPVWPLPR